MSTKKIRGDYNKFRKLVNGKVNERLKKFIKTGHIMRMRPDGNGKMSVPINQVEQPRFKFGKDKEGIGKGDGKDGEVIDRDWEPGHGPKVGDQGSGGMLVDVDMEDVIAAMEEHLRLPHMKPKNSNTFENFETHYNDISKTGPRSLVHKRRTIKQAMKRNIAQGTWGNNTLLPGYTVPVPVFDIRKDDFLYRQWNQVKIPRANALIVFGRDGSGSMDDVKCNIVSDMAFWIEKWIMRDYEKSETLYLWHDTEAKEVSQYDFYHERHGGGTKCSSILQHLKKTIKLKFPPERWNIYFIYFGDGDNIREDNLDFLKLLFEMEESMNMVGIVQILASDWDYSLRKYVDNNVEKFKSTDFIRTTSIGGDKGENSVDVDYLLDRDDRLDDDMRRALVDILGVKDEDDFLGMI